jgi:acyl carrier protein
LSHDRQSAMGKPAGNLTTEAVADQIGELVKEVLGRDIDPDENYFEAGLNSLTVVRLHTLMTKRLDVHVPVMALFRHPNVRGTAALVVESRAPHAERPVDRLTKDRDERAAGSRREIRARIRRQEDTR